jgi:hypothetical protein
MNYPLFEMNLSYHLMNTEKENSKNYTILNEKEEFVGSVEGFINEYGEFLPIVRINPEFQKKGIGFIAFHKVFKELGGEIAIKKIVGSWHKDEEFGDCEDGMSTNLRLFLNCLETDSPSNCAFKTATGKWANKLGFNKCNFLSKSSVSVYIEFYK